MNKRIWTLLGDDLIMMSNYGEIKRLEEVNKATWIKILKKSGG